MSEFCGGDFIMELNDDSMRLTNDIAAVISNEGLAVHIDELSDKRLGELRMCPQAAECDVLCPLVLHWEGGKPDHIIHKRNYKIMVKIS